MGNVEIHDGNRSVPLPRAGERCVLASLALEPGRRIHVDTLIDRLWGDDPPTAAGDTIASYLRTARKAIQDAGGQRDWLRNYRPATYQLDIDPELVDYHRFAALVAQARTGQRDGRPADAVDLYRRALGLRRAEALGNVTGRWADNRRYAIEQEYVDAACALYEQQLATGENTAVATHATHLVMEVVPTDRMIALAAHGLAGSGQHAAIPDFLARATQRMWDTAQARPGQQVLAAARQLVAEPGAQLPRPPTAGTVAVVPPDLPEADDTEGAASADAPSADHAPAARGPARGGTVILTAEHNQQVYQAAGDQYLTGTGAGA
jgi:DNA-binding SARP family transcriptional activator